MDSRQIRIQRLVRLCCVGAIAWSLGREEAMSRSFPSADIGGSAIATAQLTDPPPLPAELSQNDPPDLPEAPSFMWLVAMPAVPILGGCIIYVSRRLSGKESVPPCLQATSCPLSEDSQPEDKAPVKSDNGN